MASVDSSGKTVRGKGFSCEEDDALCRAYLRVTQDQIVGTGQTSAVFWQRVYEIWVELYVSKTGLPITREWSGLESRFKVIKTNCTKYAARLADVKRRPSSGMNEADIINKANAVWKSKEKGKAFAFHHCWAYLKDAIKWKIPINNNTNSEDQFVVPPQVPETQEVQNSVDVNEELQESSIPTTDPNKRPTGRKAAKRKIIEEGQASEMALQLRRYNDNCEAEAIRKKEKDQHMKQVFEASARREEEKADLKYLKMDTSYMPQEQREYFEQIKTNIFNKMRLRGSDSSNSGSPSVNSELDTSSDYHVSPGPY